MKLPEGLELLLERAKGIGQPGRVMIPEGALAESIGGERFFEGATFDDATQTIKDVSMIAVGWSLNNRYYTAEALRGAVALFEGVKGYVDHDMWSYSREFRDLCCKFTGVYFDEATQKLRAGSMRVLKNTPNSWIYGLAKEAPELVGLSIVTESQTQQGVAPDGRTGTMVLAILKTFSCDVVPEPAAGGGVSESAGAAGEMETPVDLKDATLEQLKKDRPDLYEAALAAAKTVEAPQPQLDKAAITEAVDAALAARLQESDTKAAQAKAVATLLESSGLPKVAKDKLAPQLEGLTEAAAKVVIDATKDAIAEATAVSGRPVVRDAGSDKPDETTKAAEAVSKYGGLMGAAFGLKVEEGATK